MAGLLAAAILLAVAIGSSTLALFGAVLALVTAIVSPSVGLMTLAIVAPLLSRPVLPAPGLLALLVAATLFGYVFRLPIERPRFSFGAPLLLLGGFLLYVLAQQLPYAFDGYVGQDGRFVGSLLAKTLTGAGAIVATALLVRDRKPYTLLAALLASAVLASMLAVLMLVGGPLADLVGNLLSKPDSVNRPSGTFGDPNYYGLFVASAIVLATGMWFGLQGRTVRSILLLVLVVLGIGLVASQSRTGVLALIAGLAVLAFVRSLRTGLIVSAAAVAATAAALPRLLTWRLETSLGASTASEFSLLAQSDEGRLGTVLAGLPLFEASPVFGAGFASYHFLTGDASHNWYMTVAAEHGLVGLILWAALIVAVVVALWRRPTFPRSIGLGVLAVLLTGSMFLDPPREDQYSVLTAIVIAAAIVGDWSARHPRPSQRVILSTQHGTR